MSTSSSSASSFNGFLSCWHGLDIHLYKSRLRFRTHFFHVFGNSFKSLQNLNSLKLHKPEKAATTVFLSWWGITSIARERCRLSQANHSFYEIKIIIISQNVSEELFLICFCFLFVVEKRHQCSEKLLWQTLLTVQVESWYCARRR